MRNTFIQELWPVTDRNRFVRTIALVVSGVFFLATCAKIWWLPFGWIGFYGITFALLLVGAAYGWRLGVATLLLYLATGAIGIPVFWGSEAGLDFFSDSRVFMYLISIVVAVALCGYMAERGWDRSFKKLAVAMLPSVIVTNMTEVWYMSFSFSVEYILGGLPTLALAAATLWFCWRLLGKSEGQHDWSIPFDAVYRRLLGKIRSEDATTLAQRQLIRVYLRSGLSHPDIARIVGVDLSVVSQEAHRNGGPTV